MSGLFKGVKKVFKKVTKFVKRYWKQIVIAAAIVFTAGVAMGYFGAAAAASGGAAAGAGAATGAATGAAAGAATGGTVFGAAGGAAALGVSGGTGALGLGTGGLLAGGTGAGLAVGGATAATAAGAGVAGGALAGGGSALGAAGGITTLPTVTAVLPTAAAGGGVAQTIGASVLAGGSTAAWSNAASSVSPKVDTPSDSGSGSEGADANGGEGLKTAGDAAPKSLMGKAWDGYKSMSSFEKMSLLSTGVQMASALTAKDERNPNEFPMQQSFYARDKDGKGPGAAYDYDQGSGQFVRGSVPQGAQTVPTDALVQHQPKDTAPARGGVQGPAGGASPFMARASDRDDELEKRMQFITGGRG